MVKTGAQNAGLKYLKNIQDEAYDGAVTVFFLSKQPLNLVLPDCSCRFPDGSTFLLPRFPVPIQICNNCVSKSKAWPVYGNIKLSSVFKLTLGGKSKIFSYLVCLRLPRNWVSIRLHK